MDLLKLSFADTQKYIDSTTKDNLSDPRNWRSEEIDGFALAMTMMLERTNQKCGWDFSGIMIARPSMDFQQFNHPMIRSKTFYRECKSLYEICIRFIVKKNVEWKSKILPKTVVDDLEIEAYIYKR
jgi:hypothetical protein